MQQPSIVLGNIVTMDPHRPRARAMGVAGGRIVRIGTEEEVRTTLGKAVREWRFDSGAVLPGFIDSHNHMLATGMQKHLVNLSACRSIADIVDSVKDYASRNAERAWIQAGQGWHIDSLAERRYPTRLELDRACADRPVYLPRIYHAAACNSKALELAGIARSTKDPVGGRIMRDGNGDPTGELHEAPAMSLVENLIPAPTRDERLSALRDIQAEYLQAGICGVIDPGLSNDDIALYEELWRSGGLKIRTVVMPLATTGRSKGDLLQFDTWPLRTGFGNSRLKLGGIKVFLDGGASLGTALMREPYRDKRCGCGIQVTPTDAFREVVTFCAANQWSLGVHTVGGRAIDLALEVFGEVAKTFDIRKLRFSIIHAYLWPTAANIAAARDLGVAIATQASMQYQFAPVLLKNFSLEAVARATPLRSWIDGGAIVAGGSDAPATPFQPMLGIWHAVTRFVDSVGAPVGIEQAITVEEALTLYTRNAAWLSFSENERGMLREGMEADWISLDVDPFTCRKEDLRTAGVSATCVAGDVLHHAPERRIDAGPEVATRP